MSAEPARSITSAVVVGRHDVPGSPAARIATALRCSAVDVVAVPRPDLDEVAAGCTAAAARAPLQAVVHAHVPAGAVLPTALVDLDDSGWTRIVDDAVVATLTTLQAARLHMGGGGAVLVVVPAVGLVGAPGYAALSAAGEAQRALAKSAARAWKPAGISVNIVAADPGDLDVAEEGPAVKRSRVSQLARGVASGSDGADEPSGHDDLVDAALLLLSAGARRTGVTLVADGGGTMLP